MRICWNVLSSIPVECMFFLQNAYYYDTTYVGVRFPLSTFFGKIPTTTSVGVRFPLSAFFVPIFSRRLFSIFVGMCGVRFPSSVCIFCKSRVNYVLFDLRRSLHVENDAGSATIQAKYNSEFRSARTKYHYSSSGNTFFPFNKSHGVESPQFTYIIFTNN